MKKDDIKLKLLKEYGVAILHMRRQLENQRLGVVFGAGVSRSIGFPDWKSLIRDIGMSEQVNGQEILKQHEANTINAQLLYQKFKTNYLNNAAGMGKDQICENYDAFGDIEIKKAWKGLVRDILYKNAPKTVEELENKDKYIKYFVKLIQKTSIMTVNYNFDDTLEKFLHKHNSESESKEYTTRGYTVVWDHNVQTEKRKNIIYHPNGYLPEKLSEFASEQLIFSEDTFEDQLIDSFSGHYNALTNHYSSATCLFVGLSLEDRTLKHMLRQNAKKCYGHVHYYVHYVEKKEIRETNEYKEYMDSFKSANFETYNLYSMFLTDDEIGELAQLIIMDDNDFQLIANEANIDISRQYFLVGSVAVGKSTTVGQLRCLQTFDEWLESMPPDMEKSPDIVQEDSISNIDKWIARQVYKKNLYLASLSKKSSINIIDRSPIDALAFTEKDKWQEKAKLLLNNINIGRHPEQLVGGTVIFLRGDKQEMYRRSVKKFREYTADALKHQQDMYQHLIDGINRYGGSVFEINVTNKTIEQVTKEVANIIFYKEYGETDFQKILKLVLEKGWNFYEV